MSKNIIAIILLISMTACGISKNKQTDMQNNLDLSLREIFLSQDKFTAFAPIVTLTDIKKSDERGAAYCGTFSCKFENINENSEIILRGIAYFDKNCNITKEGNGKAGILVMMVTENMKQLDLDSCIYNLPQFN